MANKRYDQFPAGTYNTAKIFLQADAATGALEKVNLPSLMTSWSITGNAGTSPANYIGTSDAQPLQLATNAIVRMTMSAAGNVLFGSASAPPPAPTATPFNMSFGNTYGSNAPGNSGNLKWDMYTSSTDRYGIGMSANLMEYQAGGGFLGKHGFFINGVIKLTINNAGILTPQVDTGPTLANTKIYLYNGAPAYGIGVQAAQFRLHVDTSTSRFSFLDAPAGNELFTIKGNGSVGINNSSPAASSMLDIVSTTRGFLPPRMTTAQKNAISAASAGLIVYDTTLNKLCLRTAAAWETITST